MVAVLCETLFYIDRTVTAFCLVNATLCLKGNKVSVGTEIALLTGLDYPNIVCSSRLPTYPLPR